jgi:hypothetical protein
MPGFYKNETFDKRYDRVANQVIKFYSYNDIFRELILEKLNLIKSLENKYPNKNSIKHAFNILDDISRKEFSYIDSRIKLLNKETSDDTKEFNFIKFCISSLIFFPLLMPIFMLRVAIAVVTSYQILLLAQLALLALTITLTVLLLHPIFLLATIPSSLILTEFLLEIVMNTIMVNVLKDVGTAFSSLFYDVDKPLKTELEDVASIAQQAHNHVEGSPTTRFFVNTSKSFFGLFSNKDADLQQDQMTAEMLTL